MESKLAKLIDSNKFQKFILFIIFCNAITIGLNTSAYLQRTIGSYLDFLEEVFLVIYVIEILFKIFVFRLDFFKRGWNLFDFFIVAISLISDNGFISVFRMLRVIRVMRLISSIPKMRLISQALIKSLFPMFSVGMLLVIVIYIYAIIATNLYGEQFPQFFGTLGESFYTLFQVMTGESWSMSIARPIMEYDPYAWVVFVSFLLISSYMILNIAIGIIVDCISEIREDNNRELNDRETDELTNKIHSLESEIKSLKNAIEQSFKN